MKNYNSKSKLWAHLTTLLASLALTVPPLIGAFFYFIYVLFSLPLTRTVVAVFSIVSMALSAAIVGLALTLFVSKRILKPVGILSGALDKMSDGDFSADITDKSNYDEITEMYSNFNKMAKELSGVEMLRNDFVVSVSHEFKTPLASIESCATLIQDGNLTDESRARYSDLIIQNARRLSALTGNVLALSKLDNQTKTTEKKHFPLDEQLRRTVLLLQDKWEEKSINFNMDLIPLRYYGSDSLLYQVWYNLLSNAVKFSNQNGNIGVSLATDNGYILVSICDDGIGMDEETVRHIFDKFYQGDSSRSTEGNGLGLALVKRIVTLCGGKIEVESTLGVGSKFTVSLPNTK